MYRRFDPAILESVLPDSTATNEYHYQHRQRLAERVGMAWQMEVKEFRLPPGLRVVMGDVAAGSSTPSMVRSVLKWKAIGPGGQSVWDALGAANRTLIDRLNDLREFHPGEIVAELREGMHNVRHTSRPRIYRALCKVTEEFAVFRRVCRIDIRTFVLTFDVWEGSRTYPLNQTLRGT